ncbi:hypothetical protein V2J09_019413 [Rumex salicifolius]
MSLNSPFILFFFFLVLISLPPPSLPETLPEQTFLPVSSNSPPSTIPSFPEQSAVSACPVSLPSALFPSVRSSCIDGHGSSGYGPLHRSRCCPVLAAWLYSSYAPSSLSRRSGSAAGSYDMPLLPDDSETCVDALESAMSERGLDLPRPNATCDVVYCYCGIRLRQMSCPEAFYVDGKGDLVGDRRVQKLETDCSGGGDNGGLSGCSKCLNSLNKLNQGKTGNSTAMSERTSKMRLKDCQLMGLTWLLAKNRGKYMQTVTSVLRVIMMSEAHNGSSPKSCSLNSDGMPYAVDSSEISRASIPVKSSSFCLFLVLWCLMYISLGELLAVHRNNS